MDRNASSGVDFAEDWLVALRKESVDRNPMYRPKYGIVVQSLSARRAWIEIIDDLEPSSTRKSLSARRAWIEIKSGLRPSIASLVALRKESVDRNFWSLC